MTLKIKILKSCRWATKPSAVQTTYKAGDVYEIENDLANRIIETKFGKVHMDNEGQDQKVSEESPKKEIKNKMIDTDHSNSLLGKALKRRGRPKKNGDKDGRVLGVLA